MDLNDLKMSKADEGAVMEVIHPATDEPIEGMTVTVLGVDSEVYQKLQRRKQQAALERVYKGKKGVKLDADKLAEDSISDLVAMTKAWTGFELGGEALECTSDNIRRVYTDWPWIKDQVSAFINDRANFM